jgi:hypothetical protein
MSAANNSPKIEALAQNLGLREVDTNQVIRQIARDILLSMHGKDNEQITSILLVGPPGHGKTTSFKEASKLVASALGMEFLENAKLDAVDRIDPDKHFVFVSQETAGVVSALEWLGLPSKAILQDGSPDGVPVMGRLYSARLRKAEMAGGSCVLLDDFLNASPSIQNVGLSLTEEKRFNDLNLTKSYIGLTGNLGAHDGTHTSPVSTALRNRCRVLFIQDKQPNFVARVQSRYRDAIGDAAVLGFMNRHDECFAEMPDPKQRGGYATPRSWDKFIVEARRAVRAAGGSLAGAMEDLSMNSAALLGLAVSQKYVGYMNSYIKSADPLAREIIMEGRFDKKKIEEKMKEGLSAEGQYFNYQLAIALSDYAAIKVVKDNGDYKQAVERFVQGVLPLDTVNFNMAVDNFKRVLAVKMESLSQKISDTRRDLKPEVKQAICSLFVANPECNDVNRDNVIRVMSDMNLYEDARARRTRRTGGPR